MGCTITFHPTNVTVGLLAEKWLGRIVLKLGQVVILTKQTCVSGKKGTVVHTERPGIHQAWAILHKAVC
jgi:hypothetical protein